mmetsp:Transcript_5009/g.10835  ORF Transcript_5009/g.10835 Transcript_5009/m.10835 type:complete len:453 (+) Transcript_5009:1-1359(+)
MADGDDLLSLDEVREYIYVALRAQERFTAGLKSFVDDLEKKKEGDEWLEQVQDEAAKAASFYEGQCRSWDGFVKRMEDYVASVRQEADQLAIAEMSLTGSEDKKPKSSKTIHPELVKFKLEKQARILGKYGGTPALGGAAVLPRVAKEAILKATASPAAREIQYSKVEHKDARYLAEVMQFKVRKTEEEKEAEAVSPWQAEVKDRKGKDFFKQKEELATPTTTSYTPYASELSGKLQQRQAQLSAAEEAAAAAARKDSTSTPSITKTATAELTDKLQRRQSALKAQEEEEAAAAATAAAAAAGALPDTPSTAWSNAASPFGEELSAALHRRNQQRSSGGGAQGSEATPPPASRTSGSGSASASGSGSAASATPFSFKLQQVSAPTPSTPDASSSAQPPESSSTSQVVTSPRAASAAAARRTPMIPTPAAGSNELAEKLRRRQEALQQQEQQQ